MVQLVERNPAWADAFEREAARLRAALPPASALRIEHVGATAVSGIPARPAVDILIEATGDGLELTKECLEGLGYLFAPAVVPGSVCLRRADGDGAFLLHLLPTGEISTGVLRFCDHLRRYPTIAQRYADLKRQLAAGDEDTYGQGKRAFVEEITERAVLGNRFPIEVVLYDPRWPDLYAHEAAALRSLFGPDVLLRTEHFGSTAVPGLDAKPIIDMLGVVTSFEAALEVMAPALADRGYFAQWQKQPPPGHLALWKGYVPPEPVRFHLHVAPEGHPLLDRLLFRDYLRAHPEFARAYAALKHDLARRFPTDREEYTDAKANFVREVTERARRELSLAGGVS